MDIAGFDLWPSIWSYSTWAKLIFMERSVGILAAYRNAWHMNRLIPLICKSPFPTEGCSWSRGGHGGSWRFGIISIISKWLLMDYYVSCFQLFIVLGINTVFQSLPSLALVTSMVFLLKKNSLGTISKIYTRRQTGSSVTIFWYVNI